MTDKFRQEPPRESISDGMSNLIQVWQEAAKSAAHIASAKRTLYLAYISEGFTEAQSLELCKTL